MKSEMTTPEANAAYLAAHLERLESGLAEGMTALLGACPRDPFAFLSEFLHSFARQRRSATSNAPLVRISMRPEDGRRGWNAVNWLGSVPGVVESLAASLLGPGAHASDELAAMRDFVRSSADDAVLRAALRARLAGGLDDVVEALLPRLRALASADGATGEELHSKFAEAGAYELKHLGLTAFYAGLEGMVGSPSPGSIEDVLEAMGAEHMRGVEANEAFETSNYGVLTKSATEWAFVVTPDLPPAEGWPIETKNTTIPDEKLATGRSVMRRPRPLAELESEQARVNAELKDIGEPSLVWAETVAGCLYTGPTFFKVRPRAGVERREAAAAHSHGRPPPLTLSCSLSCSSPRSTTACYAGSIGAGIRPRHCYRTRWSSCVAPTPPLSATSRAAPYLHGSPRSGTTPPKRSSTHTVRLCTPSTRSS